MHTRSFWVALGLLLATSMATAAHHESGEGQHEPVLQLISTLLGGKNVFVPSTVVVAAGQAATLSIFNTTDKPHGFSIPKLKIMEVLPDQVEHEVKLPALEAGIYPIHCHLHPAHRTATLLVVDD